MKKRSSSLSLLRNVPQVGTWNAKLWREFVEAREKLLDEIFQLADQQGLSNNGLAVKARLSFTTVDNIDGKVTSDPRWSTIWKLARAVGMDVSFTVPARRRRSA